MEEELEECESPRELGMKHVRGAQPRRKPPPQPQPQYPTTAAVPAKQSQSQPTQSRYPERGADHLRSTLGRVSASENRSAKKASQGGVSTKKKSSSATSSAAAAASSSHAVGAKRGGYQKISSVYAQRPGERERERGREAPLGKQAQARDWDAAVSYGHSEEELVARRGRRDDMSLLTASDNDVLEMLTEVARAGRR